MLLELSLIVVSQVQLATRYYCDRLSRLIKLMMSPRAVENGTLPFDDYMDKFQNILCMENPRLWVFGYGALMWRPGFRYNSYRMGFVEGYRRKFNQGNQTYRGTVKNPGRVANLEEDPEAKVWGVAFEVCGENEVRDVLAQLYNQEISNGSYTIEMKRFHPRKCLDKSIRRVDDRITCCSPTHHNIRLPHPLCGLSGPLQTLKCHQNQTTDNSRCYGQQTPCPTCLSRDWLREFVSSCQRLHKMDNPCPCFAGTDPECFSESRKMPTEDGLIDALVFTVAIDNDLYLGDDDVDQMATQIVKSGGSAGPNVEYVIRISHFIKTFIPEDDDDLHVQLEREIYSQLLCLSDVEMYSNIIPAHRRSYVTAGRVNC